MPNGKKAKLRQEVLQEDGSTKEQELDVILDTENITGGWNMTYKDPLYDFIGKLTKAEFKLYRLLESMILSKSGKDSQIIATNIVNSKTIDVITQEDTKYEAIDTYNSPTNDTSSISKILTKMIKNNIIMETSPKYYRYNPFIVLPSFAKGEKLQKEWKEIQANGPFKRRGRNILDEYYDHKKRTQQYELTFKEWYETHEDIKIIPGLITEPKEEKIGEKNKIIDDIL